MTCGCTAGSSPPVIPYQGGGGGKKSKRTKTTHRRKPKTKRRRRSTSIKKRRKLCGGNYLTGTIADGPEGTALGNMLGSQRAGSSWEINGDPIKQSFTKQ